MQFLLKNLHSSNLLLYCITWYPPEMSTVSSVGTVQKKFTLFALNQLLSSLKPPNSYSLEMLFSEHMHCSADYQLIPKSRCRLGKSFDFNISSRVSCCSIFPLIESGLFNNQCRGMCFIDVATDGFVFGMEILSEFEQHTNVNTIW